MEYDIVYCNDGVTRAVPVVKGTPQDPSIGSLKVVKEEKVKPEKPKVSIQQRINEQISTFIGEIEGKVDDFVDSDFKDKYDCYNHLSEMGCKSVHARKMRQFYIDCYNESVDV